VVCSPGLRTRKLIPSSRHRIPPPGIEFRCIDRDEADQHTGAQPKGLLRAGIEKPHWRPPDDLPAAGTGQRIDAGPATGDTDRTTGQAHTRCRAARHVPGLIEPPYERKTGGKAKHVHPELRAGVQLDEFLARYVEDLANVIEVGTVIAPVANGYFDDFSLGVASRRHSAHCGRHPLLRLFFTHRCWIELCNAARNTSDTLQPLPGLAKIVGECLCRARVRTLNGNKVVAAHGDALAHRGRLIH
jgi:hypothetical protein